MKKQLAIALFLFLFSCLFADPAFAYEPEIYTKPKPITVHVDGNYLPSDVSPFIVNGRTLIPLRAAAEALGAEVDWNQDKKTAIIKKDNITIIFAADQQYFTVDGAITALDVPLHIAEGRIMLPLRAFGEALGVNVEWNNELADVSVETYQGAPTLPQLPENSPFMFKEINWLIQKFYVVPDKNNPIVGTWAYWGDNSHGGITDIYYSYLFISKLKNDQYKVISLKYEISEDPFGSYYTGWVVEVYDDVAHKKDEEYHVYLGWKNLYYRGPGRGGRPGHAYNVFKLRDCNLVHTRRIQLPTDKMDSGITDLFKVYIRI